MRTPYLFLALLGFVVLGCADAEEFPAEGLADWQLGPNEWPTTCDAAADDALSMLSWYERWKFGQMTKDELWETHFGLGLTIRNRQGLWRGNAELLISCLGEEGHPDNASGEIIDRAWKSLQ